ncbi:MAG: hypothetical protein JRI36_03260 [Deltaproteobacteria bacterium]|nr:hypothetical protein [Deltaproteobacteria bacterium]
MGKSFKKAVIVLLVILGGLLGYWLSRQNQRLFELPFRAEPGQQGGQAALEGGLQIHVGMEIWQVKEILGPPDRRVVVSHNAQGKKETWIYGDRQLYFTNGLLMLQKESPEDKPLD